MKKIRIIGVSAGCYLVGVDGVRYCVNRNTFKEAVVALADGKVYLDKETNSVLVASSR